MYTLILYIFAGAFARGDSVTLDHVQGFETYKACQAAGNAVAPFVEGSSKEYRFVCVPSK